MVQARQPGLRVRAGKICLSAASETMTSFHVITLFPELIAMYCSTSIIGRGRDSGRLSVKTYNPRDFCTDKYRKVDDTPYGGGAGMVLKPEPFFATFL